MGMRAAYGISPEDARLDEALLLAHEGVQIFTFPGAGFRKEAARWRRTYERVWGKAFDDFVARMVCGPFRHTTRTYWEVA